MGFQRRRVFITCYAASGAAALVYQVTWIRLFTLALGHTVAASSTVLAAFMGGLAVGAWTAGRLQLPAARRLQTYALLEIIIALVALVLPLVFSEFQPLLAWAYADGDTPVRFTLVRVAVSLALLGIPATAMGATFPIAVAWLADANDRNMPDARMRASAAGGVLYAANTAGAAAGALGAGFWLIPAIGLRGTTWVGIGLNLAAALGALSIARVERKSGLGIRDLGLAGARPIQKDGPYARGVKDRPGVRGGRRAGPSGPARPVLACIAAALSGFSALIYEVGWTRLLALVIGPTTYAFATMAASFISGIALGSLFAVRLARGATEPGLWLAVMLVTSATTTAIAAWYAASHFPLLVAQQVLTLGTGFDALMLRQALGVMLLLLPASAALGATFTLALATASTGLTVARDTAYVYATNTLGAVAGALAAGFILIPRLGLETTFLCTGGLAALGGVTIAAALFTADLKVGTTGSKAPVGRARPRARRLAPVLIIAALLVALMSVPRWDRELLASGAYKYAREMSTDELEANLRAGQLEYYKEGVAGTVSVRRLGGSRALAIDGKVDASNGGDMLTQRLLGLLPLMLHPNPRDALVIGLGSGVTVGSLLASGEVRRIDVVEISPEVAEASGFFAKENGDALRAPGVRLLIGDGRSHLLLTPRQYDVIVSEPSNPWMAGIAALFTREFFETVRARLTANGIFCQWAHTYEIAPADLKSIVRTFASVFPQGTMWLVGDSDLLLIGMPTGDIQARLRHITERWRIGSVPAALKDIGISAPAVPFVLLSLFAGGPSELAVYGDEATIQTDDRMALEFTAARAMYERPPNNVPAIRALNANAQLPDAVTAVMEGADASAWMARGSAALKAGAFTTALDSFQRAVALDSQLAEGLRGASNAAAGARRIDEEVQWLRGLAAAEPRNAPVRVELSHVLASSGEIAAAIDEATNASRIAPASPEPLEQLASIFADSGNGAQLAPLAGTLVSRYPERDEGRYYRAAALFLGGRPAEAVEEARDLLKKNPSHAKAQNLLGAACATIGQLECAKGAFETAIQLTPRDPSPYLNLGSLYLQTGQPASAGGWFREALALDSASVAAREGLAQTRVALGDQ
jgi:spermidine synthase